MRNCIRYSRLLPSPSRNLPARRYLAGYLMDYGTALKLSSAISGSPITPDEKGWTTYPFPSEIEDRIKKDLRRKGLEFKLDVRFSGNEPFGTMVVTQDRRGFKGPLSSMMIQGGKEKAVREWLESKGNVDTPCLPFSYPVYRHFSGGLPVEGRVPLGGCAARVVLILVHSVVYGFRFLPSDEVLTSL